MSFDDFEVVAYKILAYLSSCLKGGVTPNVAKARELSRVNGLYFDAVVSSLCDKGLVAGGLIRDMNGELIDVCSLTLTLVECSSKFGPVFNPCLPSAILVYSHPV